MSAKHLRQYAWYLPHQSWLQSVGRVPRHDPGDVKPCRADLREADLSGANLRGADLRGADLRGADLSGADLRRANLSGADLSGANLRGADLRGADLSGVFLREADLSGANLSDAVLRGADLRGARGLPNVPKVESLDRKILAAIEAGGKLDMSNWHVCDTTHCIAGWAVVVAGEEGQRLEDATRPYLAGRLIYEESTGACPDFFADDETAMRDLRERAARTPA